MVSIFKTVIYLTQLSIYACPVPCKRALSCAKSLFYESDFAKTVFLVLLPFYQMYSATIIYASRFVTVPFFLSPNISVNDSTSVLYYHRLCKALVLHGASRLALLPLNILNAS